MSEFDDIRPYYDDEVRSVLDRLLEDNDFIDLIGRFRAPRLSRIAPGLVRERVRRILIEETQTIDSVASFQQVVSRYVNKLVADSTSSYVYEGVDKLDKTKGYLFVGNHRDIAADSMLLDYALFYSGYDTVRIAIGDNLLQRDFATHLMRLNKSFVIKRSAEGAKKVYAALLQSSKYINQSISDGHSIWIAQSEGRAKDGRDITDPALVKMLTLAQRKFDGPYGEMIASMNIVPVSISYEFDPCDVLKAKERCHQVAVGAYVKPDGEDLLSLVKGISEFKGHIKLVVGTPLGDEFETPDEVSSAIDRQILGNYQLFPSNFIAMSMLTEPPYAEIWARHKPKFERQFYSADRTAFLKRLKDCPVEFQPYLMQMYANPIVNILEKLPARFEE